MIDIDAI